jgi:glycogen debranching enzyme
MTLFGRDSLWASQMALPVDPSLARGTLQTLAERQGTVVVLHGARCYVHRSASGLRPRK